MIPEPAKAQAHVAREHPRERALATAQRHTCSAHMLLEGVAVALVIALDSSGSPGALSVPRAQSSHPAALESSESSAAPSALRILNGQPADPSFEAAQPGGPSGCAGHLSAGWRQPQQDP